MKKLIDIYKIPFTNGILFSLSNNSNFQPLFILLDMNEDDIHSMDVEYIYNNSGLKTLSSLIRFMLNELVVDIEGDLVLTTDGRYITYDKFITELDQKIINSIIKSKFLNKWLNLAKTLSIDYDVTSPYQMEIGDNVSFDGKKTNSNTRNSNSEQSGKTTSEGNNQNNDNTFGFNSVEAVPANNNDGNYTDETNNTTNSSTDTTDEGNSTSVSTTERNITRKGNIGNRSVTELIEERRNMLRYQLFDIIFSDLDSVLTCSKYI